VFQSVFEPMDNHVLLLEWKEMSKSQHVVGLQSEINPVHTREKFSLFDYHRSWGVSNGDYPNVQYTFTSSTDTTRKTIWKGTVTREQVPDYITPLGRELSLERKGSSAYGPPNLKLMVMMEINKKKKPSRGNRGSLLNLHSRYTSESKRVLVDIEDFDDDICPDPDALNLGISAGDAKNEKGDTNDGKGVVKDSGEDLTMELVIAEVETARQAYERVVISIEVATATIWRQNATLRMPKRASSSPLSGPIGFDFGPMETPGKERLQGKLSPQSPIISRHTPDTLFDGTILNSSGNGKKNNAKNINTNHTTSSKKKNNNLNENPLHFGGTYRSRRGTEEMVELEHLREENLRLESKLEEALQKSQENLGVAEGVEGGGREFISKDASAVQMEQRLKFLDKEIAKLRELGDQEVRRGTARVLNDRIEILEEGRMEGRRKHAQLAVFCKKLKRTRDDMLKKNAELETINNAANERLKDQLQLLAKSQEREEALKTELGRTKAQLDQTLRDMQNLQREVGLKRVFHGIESRTRLVAQMEVVDLLRRVDRLKTEIVHLNLHKERWDQLQTKVDESERRLTESKARESSWRLRAEHLQQLVMQLAIEKHHVEKMLEVEAERNLASTKMLIRCLGNAAGVNLVPTKKGKRRRARDEKQEEKQ